MESIELHRGLCISGRLRFLSREMNLRERFAETSAAADVRSNSIGQSPFIGYRSAKVHSQFYGTAIGSCAR